jgi:hypothetical protein
LNQDEVGLIRAIVVKAHSSAKRKEMWRTTQVQLKPMLKPVQLLLDMKVRWSLTYVMLDRAERLKGCVDRFVVDLSWEEADPQKSDKIRQLKLNKDEWERIHLFLSLLSVCSTYPIFFFTNKMF